MKVNAKGQVTIPQHIRHHLGVEPHNEVEFRFPGVTKEQVLEVLARFQKKNKKVDMQERLQKLYSGRMIKGDAVAELIKERSE